jgi:hypothetical protein
MNAKDKDDDENKPLMDKKDKADGEDSDDGAGCNERYEGVPCDGEQFIWDYEALKEENRNRESKEEIPIVLRFKENDREVPFGIRAHPDMNGAMCMWSLLVPWHAEWLVTWIYLIFSIYFWIELFMCVGHTHEYKLRYSRDWDMMLLATLGIAISLTTTTVFLIFYSVSHTVCKLLSSFDYMGKLTMVFLYTFAFVGSELTGAEMFTFLFLLFVILVINLILVQYKTGMLISYWSSVAIITLVYISDFLFTSSPKEKEVFYIPIFVELAILGAGYLLYIYQLPERFCEKNRFTQLYITGFLFFTILLINFYFEAHNILYYTLKLNSGYYSDDAEIDWWKTENIYHK